MSSIDTRDFSQFLDEQTVRAFTNFEYSTTASNGERESSPQSLTQLEILFQETDPRVSIGRPQVDRRLSLTTRLVDQVSMTR